MKIIPILAILMFLIASFVIADSPPVPTPIRGYFKINGHNVAGFIVEAVNLRTGEVVSGDTRRELVTESAGFVFDLSWFKQGYFTSLEGIYPGDPLEFRVNEFGEEGKVKLNVPKSFPYELTITIISDKTDVYYVCTNKEIVKNKSQCPIESEISPEPVFITLPPEVITKTEYICDDGTKVEDIINCPKAEIDYLLETFLVIIGLVLGTLGYKYKWLKGFAKMWQKKVEKADTIKKKKKVIESGTKAIKTVLQKDKENKYKK